MFEGFSPPPPSHTFTSLWPECEYHLNSQQTNLVLLSCCNEIAFVVGTESVDYIVSTWKYQYKVLTVTYASLQSVANSFVSWVIHSCIRLCRTDVKFIVA